MPDAIKTGWVEDADALASFVAKQTKGTHLNSKRIAQEWDDAAKSKAFFSARVTSADMLEGIRRYVARVASGEMSESDARYWIRTFIESKGDSALTEMGFLPSEEAKDAGLAELASTSRLNLIIEQNVRMARASRQHQQMQDEKDVAPYVEYKTREDGKVRNSHRLLDGLVYRVDDPDLKRIMPPQDFRCRCRLVQITQGDLDGRPVQDGLPDGWEPPKSGYTFDPEKWAEQGQEAREQWGDDLKQGFLEETSKHAEAEAAFLLKRREFWRRELTGEDPATAAEAVRNIDQRVAEIRRQQGRPLEKAKADMEKEVDKAIS